MHRPDQDILADLVPLLVQAYDSGRRYPQNGDHPQDLERRISTLWAEARAAGLTPRQIAAAARLPGRELFRWITDTRELAAAHIAEVHHLERALEAGRRDRALLARTLLDPDQPAKKMTKVAVAELFRVTRPTLDEWLKQLAASHAPTPVEDAARAASDQ